MGATGLLNRPAPLNREVTVSDFTATCTPNSQPHEDGRVEHGYQLNVLDQDLTIVATVELPDWESFDQETASSCLTDAGFVSTGAWSPSGLGYMTPVARA
jgi:hypothetical protein